MEKTIVIATATLIISTIAVPSAAQKLPPLVPVTVSPVPIPVQHSGGGISDINELGEVVGGYYADGSSVPFFYSRKSGFRLLALPGVSAVVHGLNDRGDLAGSFTDASGTSHGFWWSAATGFHTIDVPGSTGTVVADIAQDGTLIGYADYPHAFDEGFVFTSARAFVIRDGVTEFIDNPIDRPEVLRTMPAGIADDGTIVGSYQHRIEIPPIGFIVRNGRWTFITPPTDDGWEATQLYGISRNGKNIVGAHFQDGYPVTLLMREGQPDVVFSIADATAINNAGLMGGSSSAPPSFLPRATFIRLAAEGRLHIDTPNTPSRWGLNTRQRISWTYHGVAPQFLIEISRDSGRSWDYLTVVADQPGDSQNFDWTVSGLLTSAAKFRVTGLGDPKATDVNDVDIRIARATIEMLQPTPGTSVAFGSSLRIHFKHSLGARAPIAVDISRNNGQTWRTVAETETTGSVTSAFRWLVDEAPTSRARVRLRALDGSGARDVSRAFVVTALR
jgi:hypothetical protein